MSERNNGILKQVESPGPERELINKENGSNAINEKLMKQAKILEAAIKSGKIHSNDGRLGSCAEDFLKFTLDEGYSFEELTMNELRNLFKKYEKEKDPDFEDLTVILTAEALENNKKEKNHE